MEDEEREIYTHLGQRHKGPSVDLPQLVNLGETSLAPEALDQFLLLGVGHFPCIEENDVCRRIGWTIILVARGPLFLFWRWGPTECKF